MKKIKIGDRVAAKDYPDYGIGTIVFIDWANVVKFDKDIDTYSYEMESGYQSDKNDLRCFKDEDLELAPN